MSDTSSDESRRIDQPAAKLKPSPPGDYLFAGHRVRYDYARVAARLGKVTDAALAREISAPAYAVTRLRHRLGLPRHDKLAVVVPWLGRVPDRELARRHGVSPQAVMTRRRALGISPANLSKFRADALLREYVAALKRENT